MTRPASTNRLTPLQRLGLAVGGLGGVAAAVGALAVPAAFFPAYLTAYAYWLSLTLGSLALAMLCHLARSRWAAATLRYCLAGASTLPLMTALFLPLLLGVRELYPWADPQGVAADPLLAHKQPYLNLPFFLARAVIYFALWLVLARALRRWSNEASAGSGPGGRLQRLSAGGLAVLGLSTSFAAIDWLMSLEPRWYSSVYGSLVAMGGVLGALALASGLAALAGRRSAARPLISPRVLNDLGSLLLACVMLWAYLAFSQYLVIWAGNIPEEAVWYTRRWEGGWRVVTVALIVAQFALPFSLLIVREVKRSAPVLAAIATLVVVTRYLEMVWLVKPAAGQGVHWLDPALALGMGGLWVAIFAGQLRRAPLAPLAWAQPRAEPEGRHAEV